MTTNLTVQLPTVNNMIINDSKISYYEQGKGETIILLHGWPQTSYCWRKVMPQLSKKYHVIAIDLPGLGNSETTVKYDAESIATIINEFVTKLNIKKFNLVGHDVGVWIGVPYALNYESKLKTLIIIDSGIPGLMNPGYYDLENSNKVWHFYFHSVEELPEVLIEGKEREYISWFFTNKSHIKSAINKEDIEVYYQAYKGKEKLKNGFAYYRAGKNSSLQILNNKTILKIPVLAIGGKFSIGADIANAAKKVASNVKGVTLENCGHYIPEEQPNELAKLITEFIK